MSYLLDMLRVLWHGTEHGPTRYWVTRSGSTVAVDVSDQYRDQVLVELSRKIRPSDAAKGKLLPLVNSIIKRGAKRQTTICLSRATAEALHIALGRALTDMQVRRRDQALREHLSAIVSMQVQLAETRSKTTQD